MGCTNSNPKVSVVTSKTDKKRKSLVDKIHAPKIINVKTNDGGHADMDHLPHVTKKDSDNVFFDKKKDPNHGSNRNLHMFNHGQVAEVNDSNGSIHSHRSNRSASNKQRKTIHQAEPKFEEKNDS